MTKIWPFSLTPAGLGLKGKDRDKAQAYYELRGEKLHRRLAEIDFGIGTPEYEKRILEIDLEHGRLSERDVDFTRLELSIEDHESPEYVKQYLELKLKHGEIEKLEFDKELATLLDEPWVGYKDYGLEENEDSTGFWFEFDWNEPFITRLRKEGYDGPTEEVIVRKWYAELCRTVATEEGLALDIFGVEEDTGEVTAEGSNIIRKVDLGNDKTEYS